MRNRVGILIFLIIIQVSCSEHKEYIIETDINLLMSDTINGETQTQSAEKFAVFQENLLNNTVGKYLPEVSVFDISGNKFNLQEILDSEAILISSDIHCGWGLECLTNDFPNAISQLNKELIGIKIICLVKRTELDIEDPSELNTTLKELEQYYESTYVIDEKDAFKINLINNPVRLYVNQNQTIRDIKLGVSTIEDFLVNEIRLETDGNKDL